MRIEPDQPTAGGALSATSELCAYAHAQNLGQGLFPREVQRANPPSIELQTSRRVGATFVLSAFRASDSVT